ncbi:glycosyltransferase family 2 protein [Blastococcus sp. VKM Ac-2987]|uniref:glycosyltransferase family 2 protein n=1 Tax=Blastococcus sp. VKM Ac-2987 TaxID=3004141 RepID=UPI0022AB633A|nr:glycosyltransferase [Blastococcus sp. VKM Ac-2987]MCZ2858504.1 glycosyltransferase [Blastococcus sp. VKM Ac-2987]
MTRSISICIPAYNSARTVAETLESVLAQDLDLEVVVLDNASEDGTGDIVRSFSDPRITVHRNESVLPIGDNWNRLVGLSTGSLVKIVCADDLIAAGSVAAQADILGDPSVAIVSGKFDVVDEQGAVKETDLGLPGLCGRVEPRELMRTIVRRGPAGFGPTAAAMFRRADFDRVGGIRGDLVFPMDVDLFARVATSGCFYGMRELVASWRDSTFNLCATTSSLSKLTETLRFHHRIRSDHPRCVTWADVAAGDARLFRAGLERVWIRSRSIPKRRVELA